MNEYEFTVLRFLVDALVGSPENYRYIIRLVREQHQAPELVHMLDILEGKLAERPVVDRTRLQQLAEELAPPPPHAGHQLSTEEMIGMALRWSLGPTQRKRVAF